MPDTLTLVRGSVFLGGLALLALAERRWPRRALSVSRLRRWPSNLGIVLLSTLLLRLLLPLGAVGVAAYAATRGVGLLNVTSLPFWLDAMLGFVALDFAIYVQHRLFHRVPLLWRLHRMHHADLDLDVTSGGRFHPLEIVLSMLIKMLVVAALGIAPGVVVVFEIALNALAMFNHANLALPSGLDHALRRLLVTPDMHRIHHSVRPEETHSNFGFNLTWWDRLFGTYRAEPIGGQRGMTIGLPDYRDPSWLRLDRLLLLPFIDTSAATVRLIDADDLRQRLGRHATQVLDVRSAAEFGGELGHLAGAVNIPLDELPARIDDIVEWRTRPVTVVCLTDVRSSRAATALVDAGFTDVTVLRGGMRGWHARGYASGASAPG